MSRGPSISSGTIPLGGTSAGIGNDLALTYYARVPASQDVVAGAYADNVTITVTF